MSAVLSSTNRPSSDMEMPFIRMPFLPRVHRLRRDCIRLGYLLEAKLTVPNTSAAGATAASRNGCRSNRYRRTAEQKPPSGSKDRPSSDQYLLLTVCPFTGPLQRQLRRFELRSEDSSQFAPLKDSLWEWLHQRRLAVNSPHNPIAVHSHHVLVLLNPFSSKDHPSSEQYLLLTVCPFTGPLQRQLRRFELRSEDSSQFAPLKDSLWEWLHQRRHAVNSPHNPIAVHSHHVLVLLNPFGGQRRALDLWKTKWSVARYQARLSYLPVRAGTALLELERKLRFGVEKPRKMFGDGHFRGGEVEGLEGRDDGDGEEEFAFNESEMPALEEPIPSNWISIEGEFCFVLLSTLSHLGSDIPILPSARPQDPVLYLSFVRWKNLRSRVHMANILLNINSSTHLDDPAFEIIPVMACRIQPAPGMGGFVALDGEPIQNEKGQSFQVVTTRWNATVVGRREA
uniref:POPLD domain-containing protein n=1 Tax=Globodera pallida TaxID=36090 RepID=A0A183BII6_GLOPA